MCSLVINLCGSRCQSREKIVEDPEFRKEIELTGHNILLNDTSSEKDKKMDSPSRGFRF